MLVYPVWGAVAREVWKQVFASGCVAAQSRAGKSFPEEPYGYLGWCSWEFYKKNISEKVITNAFQTLESSPAPIRWVMVDDGYLHEKKGRLLNCIAQPNVNSLQTKYSALTRSSPDYNQRNKNKNKCSTYQSFASHLWMGQTVGHVSYSRSA